MLHVAKILIFTGLICGWVSYSLEVSPNLVISQVVAVAGSLAIFGLYCLTIVRPSV